MDQLQMTQQLKCSLLDAFNIQFIENSRMNRFYISNAIINWWYTFGLMEHLEGVCQVMCPIWFSDLLCHTAAVEFLILSCPGDREQSYFFPVISKDLTMEFSLFLNPNLFKQDWIALPFIKRFSIFHSTRPSVFREDSQFLQSWKS